MTSPSLEASVVGEEIFDMTNSTLLISLGDLDRNVGQAIGLFNVSANNRSREEVFYPLLKQPTHMVLVYSLAYCLVSAAALVGNVMVMAVVVSKPSMHSVTNYFLFNLAVADLLVALFCVPVNLITNLYNGE
ncbi:hypothetical protein ACOMHN_027551 [Nucella lapillus]